MTSIADCCFTVGGADYGKIFLRLYTSMPVVFEDNPMSALEKQILDKVRQLDISQQERVLEFLSTITVSVFDWDKWLLDVENFQSQIKAKYGEQHYFGTQDLLDELREETSWPQ